MEVSEGHLLEFLYACPVGLIECDAEGKIGMMNPYAMQYLLPLAGQRDPTNLFTMLEAHAPELKIIIANADKPFGRICDGHRIIAGAGSEPLSSDMKVLSCTVVRLGPDRLIITLMDVTIEDAREKRLYQSEAANVAKSQFLANMSHEMRTPLNGVLGMAQALFLESMTPSQQEKIQTILTAGEGLLCFINDILDVSALEVGDLKLETAPFDFEQLVTSSCSALADAAKAKGLQLILICRAKARGQWEGDALRCSQILSSLLSNALKFTTTGEVRVVLAHSESGGARLCVSDTGMGIDAGEIPKLFSNFYQVDTSTTRRFGGSGVGLSICHGLVRMMGGTVTIESKVGAGSCFTVEIPLKFIASMDAETAHEATEDRIIDFGTQGLSGFESMEGAPGHIQAETAMRILAAEDNPTNQLILRTLLQSLELDLAIVDNGRLAVEAWENGQFDLILMDIQMPELDGVDATKVIRAREIETGRSRTPIIAVTANVMQHQVVEYRRVGMDRVVAKPIQLAELCQAIDEAMAV